MSLPHRKYAENMYYFSELALTLNAPESGTAPTDSRHRPDQRLMENGRWDEANAEKQRLEEKQRLSRKKREAEAARATEDGKKGAPPLPKLPVCPPRRSPQFVPPRDTLRPLQAAVVRAQEGPGDAGAGARLQGGVLGEQGQAGLELVSGHFLSWGGTHKKVRWMLGGGSSRPPRSVRLSVAASACRGCLSPSKLTLMPWWNSPPAPRPDF